MIIDAFWYDLHGEQLSVVYITARFQMCIIEKEPNSIWLRLASVLNILWTILEWIELIAVVFCLFLAACIKLTIQTVEKCQAPLRYFHHSFMWNIAQNWIEN